jgi:anaerobic magnesium-protoporphyrin IX monomethyl ester cyclase
MSVLIAQLPSPPHKNVFREWAGGLGTALPTARASWGHDQSYYDIPFAAYLYVARMLEQAGIAYRYTDFQALESLELTAFDAAVSEAAPRVLVTQVNLPSLEHDLELLARARRVVPGLQILLLGAAGRLFRERILRDGLADAVMEGSEELLASANAAALLAGDDTALQACHVWRDGAVLTLPARQRMTSLDFIAFPAYELLNFSRYESDFYFGRRYRYATVFTTKGCPYSCGYCPYPFGFGNRLVYRAPDLVAADVARLRHAFGVEQILFRDQVFSINPRHTRAVCAALRREAPGIIWVCETRYDLVDQEMLATMYAAGCREIHYGLESADPEIFAATAKSDGPKSLDLFAQVIGWTKAIGMRVHVHLIVGLPDESWRSVRNTSRWLRRARPDSVQLSYFVPYPGTPIYDELRASGELGDVAAMDWESLSGFDGPVIRTRHLSVDEVARARNRISVDWQYSLADRVVNRVRRIAGLPNRTPLGQRVAA